jgi:citrate synthase
VIEGSRRSRHLTAAEAAARLGVSRNSLYAYVSRGRIHAESDPRNPRASRYLAVDVERLRDQKEARLHPEAAARKTLAWGTPVLGSSVTLIDGGRLYYRGHDALALAQHAQFEDVVRLLWSPDLTLDLRAAPLSGTSRKALRQLRTLPTWNRMQAILPFAAADDDAAFDIGAAACAVTAWGIVNLLTVAATLQTSHTSQSIAARLAQGWHVRARAAVRLLDLALILCADHELNVSAFAVRVVASTRTSLYDVVAAGLAALRGPRHGGFTAHVESLLDESGAASGVRRAIVERLRRGESIPGFGHPLYPDGDPRARAILAAVEQTFPSSKATAFLRAGRHAGRTLLGDHPNLDYALVVLRRALGLPRGSALVLFALGRTVGWMAHAMEQYQLDQLIRPRAAYTGPMPARRRT